ncbi:unnamed protein product [Closterium sp. NIES-53]
MALLRVLVLDHEGRPLRFDTWLDDLQLYLLSDSRDSVSLFDHTSGAAPAPPDTADSATRSQWLTRDVVARFASRNHLPLAECAHLGQHRTAHTLYDAVVARYSSPATAALGRLLLLYLFPELSAFATVEDLVSHLRASNTRYRTVLPAEFLDWNPPPMDHFLSLDPTSLTVDLLEQHLLAAETSAVAVGAARGTPRTPFFEGCSPSPLAPSYASAAGVEVLSTEDVGTASASAKCCSSKGKGGKGGGGGSGSGGGGNGGGSGCSRGGGIGGSGGGSGGVGGGGGGSGGRGGGSGSGGRGGGRSGAPRGGYGGGQWQRQQHRSETPLPQQLHEWLFQRGASRGSMICPYVIRTGEHAGQTCGKAHNRHRCFSRLDDAWRAEFGDEVERPHWAELLRSGVAIFALAYDAILFAMYALSTSAEGDCHRCVPPDPHIDTSALGGGEYVLPGTAPVEALHTFTLDSGASCCFFRDSTTLTPLPAPVPVRLADPFGDPVVARSSTVLSCLAVPFGSLSGLHLPSFSTNLVSSAALQDAMVTTTTPAGQRVSICTCIRTSCHLATFTRWPGSSLYTLTTEPPQVAASAQVSASHQVAPPCSCRLLSHQTLLWHHRLGRPSLPRLRGMHSRLLISGLPRTLPLLPPLPAPPCLPCVRGRQRTAPHSSSFPLTTAPLQTLHMDVRGPARVSGQGRERYFLLVVDDYTRYTTVFFRVGCAPFAISRSYILYFLLLVKHNSFSTFCLDILLRYEQVDPHGSILWMGPPLSSAATLSIARLGRALPVCLPRAFFFPPHARARGSFLTVAPPWGPRDALLCPSCAPWRAAVPCLSRAPGRTAVLSPGGLVRVPPPLVARRGAYGGPRSPNYVACQGDPGGGGDLGGRASAPPVPVATSSQPRPGPAPSLVAARPRPRPGPAPLLVAARPRPCPGPARLCPAAAPATALPCVRVWGWRVGDGRCVGSPAPPPTPSPTATAAAEGGGCVGDDRLILWGPAAPRAPCCPVRPARPAALRAPRALLSCCPARPAALRALLPCSPVRPAALQPCAPLLPCCPVLPARPAAAATALAAAATALAAAATALAVAATALAAAATALAVAATALAAAATALAAAATALAVAATAHAAAATALAAAATVLAAAATALPAVLRTPRALQPCAPRTPCCLVRPAALCTRICSPMHSPYPAPLPSLFLLPLPAARAAVGVGGWGGEGRV